MAASVAAIKAAQGQGSRKKQQGAAQVQDEEDYSKSQELKRQEREEQRRLEAEAEAIGGFWKYQLRVERFYTNLNVQIFVACLIGGNFMCNIIEKQVDPRGKKFPTAFSVVELFFNIAFTIELAVNMYGFWCWRFWKSGWNIFDFVVVSVGILFTLQVPLPGPFGLLRMMRAFRVFRLFKRVESLNRIIVSLARAVPGVMNAFLIVLIFQCIYAILGVDLFMEYAKDGKYNNVDDESIELTTARGMDYGDEYYGNFLKSWYTMFQVLTGESWSEAVARPLLFGDSAFRSILTATLFTSYLLIVGQVLINVVVAVLLEEHSKGDGDESSEEIGKQELPDETDGDVNAANRVEMAELRRDLDGIKQQLETLVKIVERSEQLGSFGPSSAGASGSGSSGMPTSAFAAGPGHLEAPPKLPAAMDQTATANPDPSALPPAVAPEAAVRPRALPPPPL